MAAFAVVFDQSASFNGSKCAYFSALQYVSFFIQDTPSNDLFTVDGIPLLLLKAIPSHQVGGGSHGEVEPSNPLVGFSPFSL